MIHRFTEIDLRGSTHAIGAIPKVNLVQIQLEDLVFTQQLFNADRQEHFFDLTHQRTFRAQEEVSRQLLGNGTRPLRRVTREQCYAGRTEDPHRVHPVVLIKAAVFCGDKGFNHYRRHLIQRDRDSTFLAILRD